MKSYLIRRNCEYTLVVEAESDTEALETANAENISEWSEAWSDDEIDEDESEMDDDYKVSEDPSLTD